MEIDKSLEEKLWNVSPSNPLGNEIGKDIVDYLLARLSDFLQKPLEMIRDYGDIDDAFCIDFRTVISSQGNLCITLGGTLGMQFIDEDFGSHTSANLYLFANHERLITDKNHTYIYLEYVRDENGFGQWINQKWDEDEFWEYESIKESEFF